jgi:hypothetical protein
MAAPAEMGTLDVGSNKVSKETIEKRKEFVQSLLARSLYDTEIINVCERSDLFAGLTRGTIRARYLYLVKREICNREFDADEEISKAYDKMQLGLRMAAEQGNPQAMARVQKEISRMLGLRRPPSGGDRFDVNEIREQVRQMDWSVAPPSEQTDEG